MKFSNENLKEIIKHKRPILTVNRFDNNDHDHYYSLSDNSEFKEWTIDCFGGYREEIETIYLLRPKAAMLTDRGHPPTQLGKMSTYFKITYTISYGRFLINGYEDGLILIWRQERRDIINKTNLLMKSNSKAEIEISRECRDIIEEGDELVYEKEPLQNDDLLLHYADTEIINQSMQEYMKEEEEPMKKSYFNIMWLHYILIGHTQAINNMIAIPDRNYLITSSNDHCVKFFDMTTGLNLYHIDIQTEGKFMMYINIPKPKLEKLVILSSPNNKIEIKINADGLGINNSTANFASLQKVLFFNKKFYLIQQSTQMLIYTADFRLEKEVAYPSYEKFIDMIPYRDYFIFFSADKKMHLCEIVNDKLVRVFVIQVGRKTVSNLMLINDNILYMTNLDGTIYSIDLNMELELLWNRKNMLEEEKVSVLFNKFLDSRKNKKKKKGKGGKKGGKKKSGGGEKSKSKSKSKSPGKKKASPPKKK